MGFGSLVFPPLPQYLETSVVDLKILGSAPNETSSSKNSDAAIKKEN